MGSKRHCASTHNKSKSKLTASKDPQSIAAKVPTIISYDCMLSFSSSIHSQLGLRNYLVKQDDVPLYIKFDLSTHNQLGLA